MLKKILLISSMILSTNVFAEISVQERDMKIEKGEAVSLYNNPSSSEAQISKAIVIFEKYSQNDPQMLYYLGLAHMEAKTKMITLSYELGINYIEQAAVRGNSDAEYEYSMYLMKNKGFKEGLAGLKKSALAGQSKAQYRLGKMYYQGNGVPKNKQNGFSLIKSAAESKHPEAQYDLAKIFFAQSDQEVQRGGVYWLNQAVSNKNYNACDDLYKIYHSGILVQKDNRQHLKFLTCSAMNDNQDAQLLLASYYLNGKYVKKNPSAAHVWYEKLKDAKVPEGIYQSAIYTLAYNQKDTTAMRSAIMSLNANASDHLESANLAAEIRIKGLYGESISFATAVTFLEHAKSLGDQEAQNKIIYLLSEEDRIQQNKKRKK